jgi:hypothetical protein
MKQEVVHFAQIVLSLPCFIHSLERITTSGALK